MIEEIVASVIGIPVAAILAVVGVVALVYCLILLLQILKARSMIGLREIKNLTVKESTDVPGYEPAIMGYLVNSQKIGKREICSTLLDLIGRRIIKITITRGLTSDNNSEYVLTLDQTKVENVKNYEETLIKYLFGKKDKIDSKKLSEKLYKTNINPTFYSKFLKQIQEHAKQKDFFDKKTGKRKIRTYKIVNGFITVVASVTTFFGTLGSCALEGLDVVDMDTVGVVIVAALIFLAAAAILWLLKFLVTFMFNLNCYYNEFSENGYKDYKKWIGFKKYLKTYSSIPNHPILGITVWQRYYAYAIGLKCSKKFFKQMKTMKIVDNSIDIQLFETFNDIVDCIGTSVEGMKQITIDEHGGSHVEY